MTRGIAGLTKGKEDGIGELFTPIAINIIKEIEKL